MLSITIRIIASNNPAAQNPCQFFRIRNCWNSTFFAPDYIWISTTSQRAILCFMLQQSNHKRQPAPMYQLQSTIRWTTNQKFLYDTCIKPPRFKHQSWNTIDHMKKLNVITGPFPSILNLQLDKNEKKNVQMHRSSKSIQMTR